MTLVLCGEDARCCNAFNPEDLYLQGPDSHRYNLSGSASHGYRLSGSVRGPRFMSNTDCAWGVRDRLLHRIEVTVIGRLDGDGIQVERLCR